MTKRVGSGTLVEKLGTMHSRAMDDHQTDYVMKPCPTFPAEQVSSVLEAKIDNDVRELILAETRLRMTQRLSLRTSIRRSIRVRERSITTPGRPDDSIAPEGRRGRGLGNAHLLPEPRHVDYLPGASTGRRPQQVDLPQAQTPIAGTEDEQQPDDSEDFIEHVKHTVSNAFGALIPPGQTHEVAFHIAWQLRQCIRDELEGSPDLGPILTLSGTWKHTWATTCHQYVQRTWGTAGEHFLMDLEILLGKKFDTLG